MDQTTQQPEQLQNEYVRFTVHHRPACVVELDVEALEPLMKMAHKKAVKAVSKEVSLPGFRKGKVPDELVAKNYTKEIEKEAEQVVADLAFQECQKLVKVRLLHRDARVTYNMKSHSPSGALLTLAFETEPTVPTVDGKEIHLKEVKRPEVNDEKINETIRQVQFFFADWKKVEDRPIQEEDLVTLDVDVIEDTPVTHLFSSTRFEVTRKAMAKWMYDLVLGKQAGDVLEGVSVPDETASEEEKELLKPKKVQVRILSVDGATLPPLDESFAQKLGVPSVEELREKIRALLNNQADAHVKEALREQVNELLLTNYPFELPVTLVNKEMEFRLRQLDQDAEFKQYWMSLSEEERKNTIHTIRTQSEKAVRMFYLSRTIIAKANIRISGADLPTPSSEPLEVLLDPQKLFHHSKNAEVEHAEAFSRLVLEKAADYLIAQGTVNPA